MSHAESVFTGLRVSSITVLGRTRFGIQPLQRYVFAVERALKGTVGSRVILTTQGSNCDFLFLENARYLVFVEPPDWTAHQHASICLRTRKLSDARGSSRPWQYLIEPAYRPIWGTLVFFAVSVVRPPYLEFDPHAWQLRIAWTLLAAAALLLAALTVPSVRTRAGRRLFVAAAGSAVASFAMCYSYLYTSIWFAHLLH
jgi:hypothetical protein